MYHDLNKNKEKYPQRIQRNNSMLSTMEERDKREEREDTWC